MEPKKILIARDDSTLERARALSSYLLETYGSNWGCDFAALTPEIFICRLTIKGSTRSALVSKQFLGEPAYAAEFGDKLSVEAAKQFNIEITTGEVKPEKPEPEDSDKDELGPLVQKLIEAGREVVANWEGGDLADAVNDLDSVLRNITDVFGIPDEDTSDPVVTDTDTPDMERDEDGDRVAICDQSADGVARTVEPETIQAESVAAPVIETMVGGDELDVFAEAALVTKDVAPRGYVRERPVMSLFSDAETTLSRRTVSSAAAVAEAPAPANCTRCGTAVSAAEAAKCKSIGIEPIHAGCAV